MANCIECKGTGSTEPDCELCNGYRSVSAKRAYAKGWKKIELPEVEHDGYCECPLCYDTASTCMFCYGDGVAISGVEEQQRMRVLICALWKFIPPVFYVDHYGEFIVDRDMDLLSSRAGGELHRENLISWWKSIFGDEIYITPKGIPEAKAAWREYRALCKRWIVAERNRSERIAALRAAKLGQEAVTHA